MSELLLQRTREWAQARVHRLAAKHEMEAAGGCEAAEPVDLEVGDGGRGPCYRMLAHVEDYCDTCKRRDPLFHEMVSRRRMERLAFRRLCALAERDSRSPR